MGPIIDPSSTPPTRRVRRESAPRSTCAGKKAALSASSQGRQGGRAQVHRSSTHSSSSTMSPTSATRSLAIHPETTTHSQLSPEDQLFTGVSESYVRLSIDESRCRQRIAELSRTTAGTSSPPCASRQATSTTFSPIPSPEVGGLKGKARPEAPRDRVSRRRPANKERGSAIAFSRAAAKKGVGAPASCCMKAIALDPFHRRTSWTA